MMNITIDNLFTLDKTIAKYLFEGVKYPWEVLSKIKDEIIAIGNRLDKDEYYCEDGNIWIAKSAKIAASACINGPAIIGENTEIRHCAYIRGNAIIGNNVVVGNSTELKNVILFDEVQVPHYNYVGDSILGYKAHMGAGSVTSNVKSDKSLIVVKSIGQEYKTNLRKFGAMIGDCAEIGCNAVLNPGTIVGAATIVYPLVMARGCIPKNSIYKNSNEIVEKYYL